VFTLRNAPYSLQWGSSVYAKIVAENIYGESIWSQAGNGAVIITYADAPKDLAEDVSRRTSSSITFSWHEGDNNGGSDVIDYRLSFDQATGSFVVLAASVTGLEYTATGLTFGETYTFKLEAQNAFGYSAYSEEIAILCAARPEKPEAPTSTVVNDYVIVNWDTPVDNGMPITGYNVFFRQADLEFITDRTICDGLDYTVLTNTQCIVSLSDLQSEPFNLLLGVAIQVKVQAINAYGESDISDIGGLATVQQVPLKPVSLTDLVEVTSDSVIGFSWTDGASDGDSPVIDYRISYD
jgi:hypothetical protein